MSYSPFKSEKNIGNFLLFYTIKCDDLNIVSSYTYYHAGQLLLLSHHNANTTVTALQSITELERNTFEHLYHLNDDTSNHIIIRHPHLHNMYIYSITTFCLTSKEIFFFYILIVWHTHSVEK